MKITIVWIYVCEMNGMDWNDEYFDAQQTWISVSVDICKLFWDGI